MLKKDSVDYQWRITPPTCHRPKVTTLIVFMLFPLQATYMCVSRLRETTQRNFILFGSRHYLH